jgi:hypothetical protein
MPEVAENHRERSRTPHASKPSLHERVMADPDTMHSYFNTTEGMLTGDPAHQDMNEILRVLDDNGIIYLYDPDTNRPRPTFFSPGTTSIGLVEISQAARRLSAAS